MLFICGGEMHAVTDKITRGERVQVEMRKKKEKSISEYKEQGWSRPDTSLRVEGLTACLADGREARVIHFVLHISFEVSSCSGVICIQSILAVSSVCPVFQSTGPLISSLFLHAQKRR